MMALKACWYVACWAHELEVGTPRAVRIIDEPIVLYRTTDGAAVALEDRCVHRLAPLSLGRCEGDHLRCMYHGLLFAPDGHCVEIPGQDQVPAKAAVRSYAVEERDGWLWVWMDDPATADPTLIPVSKGLDDPDWILGHGSIEYDADYRLLNDNLTDFSHLSFVHANSFNSGLNWSLSRPKITQLDRGIHVQRWVENDPVPPYLQHMPINSVDQWVRYDYLAPGVLLMTTEIHAGGSAARAGDGQPDGEPLFATFSAQAVTPIDARRTRYFFSWGPGARFGGPDMAETMMGVARQAFEEDRIMIEAQQRVIDADPARLVMPISADKGVVLFQGVMKSLAQKETGAKSGALTV